MKKIVVKVCLGTTCFVMGSSNLQSLTEMIPQKFGDKVEIVGSSCLGVCSTNWEISKAPYIKVNDVLIQEATVEKVLQEIEAQLAKGR
jgi:NADH:ubiquinone oxidoreductase subunit E